jgi:DNA-binding NarL/FixJ family response regulator
MIRVLLADHHPVVRRGLRAVLESRQDLEVCAEACNGREAVEFALQHRPDVAILDIPLPVLNGIEATRQIRGEVPDTEVMFFTLYGRERDLRDVLQAGARSYVLKTETEEHIIRAVEALARHQAYFSDHVSETLLNKIDSQAERGNGTPLLTARERTVVQLLAEGNSNKKTANLLSISVKTVEAHRWALMRKLDIHCTAQLVRYAFREGLAQP